jgi:hypothetical protein
MMSYSNHADSLIHRRTGWLAHQTNTATDQCIALAPVPLFAM